MSQSYKIQWRPREGRFISTDLEWRDMMEEWSLREHAELRKSQYWEKLSFAHLLEFRVEEASA